MVRRCWVNFQCQGVLLTWLTVGQGPIVLSVGAGGGCLDIFSLIYHFSFISPSLRETARYRLKYCLKGPLSPKQPTNQSHWRIFINNKQIGISQKARRKSLEAYHKATIMKNCHFLRTDIVIKRLKHVDIKKE